MWGLRGFLVGILSWRHYQFDSRKFFSTFPKLISSSCWVTWFKSAETYLIGKYKDVLSLANNGDKFKANINKIVSILWLGPPLSPPAHSFRLHDAHAPTIEFAARSMGTRNFYTFLKKCTTERRRQKLFPFRWLANEIRSFDVSTSFSPIPPPKNWIQFCILFCIVLLWLLSLWASPCAIVWILLQRIKLVSFELTCRDEIQTQTEKRDGSPTDPESQTNL